VRANFFSKSLVAFLALSWGFTQDAYSLTSNSKGSSMKSDAKYTPSEGRGNPKTAYLNKSVDQMIYDFMEKENIPGLVLAIVQAPYIPRVVGYGISDIQKQLLASTNTIWAVGPISQAYAAVAAFQLHEMGKLNINDKISKFLPNLPAAWKEITVFQLLQHATGISDYRAQKNYDPPKKYTAPELIASVGNIPLLFTPGTDVSQSATNFLLVAEVVEAASQMSYHQFVRKNQIERLELKNTCFFEDIANIKQEKLTEKNHQHSEFKKNIAYINPTENATGYNQKLEIVPFNDSAVLKGFGDVWASAEDVSFWDIGLAGSILIEKPENRDLIYKPTTLSNGKVVRAMAGWEFPFHPGLLTISGTMGGFSSYLSRFTHPAELLCVTLLANKEGIDFTNLARLIASAFSENFASGYNDDELYLYESVFNVQESMSKIESELKKLNIPIFAKFDHSKNAETANLKLRPTQVIVFGSPAVGTQLMQENQSISLELPLRIAVWEDAKGSVWIAFPRMDQLAVMYSHLDSAVINKMEKLLQKIVEKSANVYQ
jgi:CubicO group peptidase (beta-lactamase class C family)/uncharacterized protein (DUF302 family)